MYKKCKYQEAEHHDKWTDSLTKAKESHNADLGEIDARQGLLESSRIVKPSSIQFRGMNVEDIVAIGGVYNRKADKGEA